MRTKAKMVKPPIGVIPKKVYYEAVVNQRIEDLADAMKRYFDAGYAIPTEWVEEYNGLIEQK